MATNDELNSAIHTVTSGLDHFDPFQGFVDEDKQLNLRYGFRIGKINLLIGESMISEIVKKPTIYPIPNTPSWIQGLINLRGILVPVLDIRSQLEQEQKKYEDALLLVLDKGEHAFSTLIEALPTSINLDQESLVKTAIPENEPDVLKQFTHDAFTLNDEVWFDINFPGFIKHITREYSKNTI